MMGHLLVIEVAEDLQHVIRSTLGDQVQITFVQSGLAALDQVDRGLFDLILLDVMLPDLNGFQLCAKLRQSDRTRETPIVILTPKGEVEDKITGFSHGADDCIVTPFDPREFRARIQSKLRKVRAKTDGGDWIRKGDLRVSVELQKAVLVDEAGKETVLSLTPNEFKLLNYLIRHEDHVLSRNQLLASLWGDRGIHVLDRTIDKHISDLRKKLCSKEYSIVTVPGTGYRFTHEAPRKLRRRAA